MYNFKMIESMYYVLWRIYIGLDVLFSAVITGFFLGIFTEKQIYNVTNIFYSKKRKYHLCGMDERLFVWEEQAIARFFPRKGVVLVGAAGGGREFVALINKGFSVDAFECNEECFQGLQAVAKKISPKSLIYKVGPSVIPEIKTTYAAFIMGWSAYMHIPSKEKRIAFLKQVYSVLQPGAPVLLSFTSSERDYLKDKVQRMLVYYIAATLRLIFLRKQVQRGDTLNGLFAHYFTKAEITEEIVLAGLELEYYQDWSVCPHVVAMKP